MIRTLFNKEARLKRLFEKNKEFFLKQAFSNQSKPVNFALLEFAFIDSNGKRYYKYPEDFDIPILRMEQLNIHVTAIKRRLDDVELDKVAKAIIEQADEAGNSLSVSGKIKNFAQIHNLAAELLNREKSIYKVGILFQMVSCLYIREDQNPALWDQELENEKVEQFKKDSAGGLADFFYNAGLQRYIPFIKKSEEEFAVFMKNAEAEMEALQTLLNIYSLPEKSNTLSKKDENKE